MFKFKKDSFLFLALSAANSGVLLFLNVLFPTNYIIPDCCFKLFFILSLLVIFICWAFLLFIKRKIYEKHKRWGLFIFFLLASIYPFYIQFSLFSFLGKRLFFYDRMPAFLLLSMLLNAVFFFFLVVPKERFLKKEAIFTKKIYHFFLILSPFIVFTFYNTVKNVSYPVKRYEGISQSSQKNKRIVFLLFDEMDKEIVFDLTDKVKMENFQKLKAFSFFAEKTLPAGEETYQAIPALTTGIEVSKYEPYNRDTLFIFDKEKRYSWKDQKTIFSLAKDSGYRVACMGWHHRYNRLFHPYFDYCFDHFSYIRDNSLLDAIKGMPRIFVRIFNKFKKSPLFEDNYFLQKFINFKLESEKILKNKSYDFVFIHYPFPHAPTVYEMPVEDKDRSLKGYLYNLKVSDYILGHFLNNCDDENTILIVMSDHHLRASHVNATQNPFVKDIEKELKERKELLVPFFIKLPNAKKGCVYQKPFNAREIFFIVQNLIEDKIVSYEDIALFLDKKQSSRQDINQ